MRFLNNVIKLRYTPQILLLLVLIIGYWQVVTFHYSLKFDMIDCYYPWRYMVGECLQNGMLPWWNPYQTLGYPIHADPQSGAWYPLAWIIGGLWGYDMISLEIEFLIHIYLAGLGMFFLGKILGFTKSTSFLLSAAYMFSGFIIGNAQHLTYVISAAWIPFILAYFLKFNVSKKYIHALIAAFFLYMLISGGYPAFTVIQSYFLVVLMLCFLWSSARKKEWRQFFHTIKLNSVFFISALLFSAVVLVSVNEVTAYITRGSKLPWEVAKYCPLSPQSLISFLFPFAVVRDMDFYKTDLSMTNIYIGLIIFMFFVYSFFRKKPALIKIFFWWGLFCLFAALGEYTPVRKFLYDYFPMMGFFRFPSLFRLFAVIGFLVTTGFVFEGFFKAPDKKQRRILWIFVLFISVSAFAIVFSRMQGYLNMKEFIRNDLFNASALTTRWQHLAFHAILQIGLIAAAGISIILFKNAVTKKRIIIGIAVFDIMIAAWLNEPHTTYSHIFTVKNTMEISNEFPDDFPLPSQNSVIGNCDAGLSKGTFWKNMNIFHKEIAWDGFTPFKFRGYEVMNDSFPLVFKSTLTNPPVFLTDQVYPQDSVSVHEKYGRVSHKNIYMDLAGEYALIKNEVSHEQGDTAVFESFSPSSFVVKTHSQRKQVLCVLQNYYPGWEATIDHAPCKMMTFTKGLMCVEAPAGEHLIEFRYSNKNVLAGLFITLTAFLVFISLLLIMFVRSRKKSLPKNEIHNNR